MVATSLNYIFALGFRALFDLVVQPVRSDSSTNLPALVPAVHFFQPSPGNFKVPKVLSILIDQDYVLSTKDIGLTLIPPPLLSFAQTFASDFQELFPDSMISIATINAASIGHIRDRYVFLTLSDSINHTLASGVPTTEGYEMAISTNSVTIRGSGAKGAFWATRTLLQGFILGNGRFPNGVVRDQPDWATRGIMLDAGRHWYPISFLKEVCAYASWFKISEFHVHLSDNVNPRGHPDAYARFRLRAENPQFAGLAPHVNETYSRAEFEDFQQSCAARGITVIPEIESPGHALVVTQWKSELALQGDPTLINLTVPDAIPTIKSIWKGRFINEVYTEYLPWLHSKQVSIGADEYNEDFADDYNNFVNIISDFMRKEANKTVRIWSTNEPSNKTSVSKRIIKQHWAFHEGDPYGLIREGYNVINSEDSIHYIVMKQPQPDAYPQRLNQTRLWNGANVQSGGIWDPHIFDRGNASNNPNITEPLLKGSIMAVWNDHGPNASTVLEAFYAFKAGLPVIAAVNWQAASRPNHLTHAQFLEAYPKLKASTPGQNLHRRVASKGSVVVNYQVLKSASVHVPDTSGNGYHGVLEGGVIETPLGSKGHDYTLRLVASFADTPSTFLAGPDTSFGFASIDSGHTLAFTTSGTTYPLFNYSFAHHGLSSVREIILTGTEDRTSAWVDGVHVGDFLINIDGTNQFEPMAFVAPVQEIGGLGVNVHSFCLWDKLQEISKITGYK